MILLDIKNSIINLIDATILKSILTIKSYNKQIMKHFYIYFRIPVGTNLFYVFCLIGFRSNFLLYNIIKSNKNEGYKNENICLYLILNFFLLKL